MHIREAVESRYSCRAFLPKPVSENIVREILQSAARAPSGVLIGPRRWEPLFFKGLL